jgi:hypothetical protein
MALRWARDQVDGRPPNKSLAAHIESERFSTAKTQGGKPVPSDRDRLRQTFDKFAPVVHLWGASSMVMNDATGHQHEGPGLLSFIVASRSHLRPFLAAAFVLEDILKEAIPNWQPISVPALAFKGVDLSGVRIWINPEDPRVEKARSTHTPRRGG